MIYDKLPVALLSLLSSQAHDATSAQVARHILAHADAERDLSVTSSSVRSSLG